MKLTIVQIALDLPLDKNFDFYAPDVSEADVGKLAVVPFGNKLFSGVIVGVSAASEIAPDKLKRIKFIQRALPKFSADDVALFRFCQSYYHHPFGPIALNGLPPAMRATRLVVPKAVRVVTITELGREALKSIPMRAVAQRAMLATVEHTSQTELLLRSRHERAAATLRILLPLCLLWSLLLASQGVPSTLARGADVIPMDASAGMASQHIPVGPVAPMVAAKQLGTNGGGWYGPNSAVALPAKPRRARRAIKAIPSNTPRRQSRPVTAPPTSVPAK